MSDIIQLLPNIDTEPFEKVLERLEKANISSNDLMTLGPVDVARRADVSIDQVRELTATLIAQLHAQLGFDESRNGHSEEEDATAKSGEEDTRPTWSHISTLDDDLDAALGGGFPAGQVCEITGESAAGKTQLLLTLLLAVQLAPPKGLGKTALYLSTEAPLSTTRLNQILTRHPYLSLLSESERPSLSRVQSAQLQDLESQDHVLRYQVPVQIARANVGLIIIDSIAANFRAEFDRAGAASSSDALARRSLQLTQLGSHLRDLARTHNVAVVVANQVLDRFGPIASYFDAAVTPTPLSQSSVSTQVSNANNNNAVPPQLSQQPIQVFSTNDPLSLDHQQRFFTGWGDQRFLRDLKTPSLGLTWTNQLSARIVLLKQPILKPQDYLLGPGMDIVGWKRHLKVAFSAWSRDNNGVDGVEFEVCEEGIRSKRADDNTGTDEAT
ncbi:P-loop containing nucleoside triphosphate hydrolase protein [Aureobasidium pullulans]|nr:P-loop containing nucleoside triphosphate hydrolase protein [Aureobasidium pullulans]